MGRATLLAIAFGMAVSSGTARAQMGVPMPPTGGGGLPPVFTYMDDEPSLGVSLFLRGTGLSDEQRHKVHHILSEHRPRLQAAKRRVRAAQDALADRMTTAGALTAKDLNGDVDRLTQAHRDQILEIVATAVEVRTVLTAEQLARAARWKDRFQNLRGQMEELVDEDGASTPPR